MLIYSVVLSAEKTVILTHMWRISVYSRVSIWYCGLGRYLLS